MTFAIAFKNQNSVTSLVHRFVGPEVSEGMIKAVVRSFVDQQAYADEVHNWHSRHDMPMAAYADPEAWLTGPSGPFAGAVSIPETGELDREKAFRIAAMKSERDGRETGGFWYLEKFFDTDERSYLRMTAAHTEAMHAIASGDTEFSKTWILADNSAFAMNAAEMSGLIPAFAAYGTQLNVTYNILKAQILAIPDGPDALAQVRAVAWPIPAPPTDPESPESP